MNIVSFVKNKFSSRPSFVVPHSQTELTPRKGARFVAGQLPTSAVLSCCLFSDICSFKISASLLIVRRILVSTRGDILTGCVR